MYIGIDYYPEQWDYDMIDADIKNMIEMGINIVRIGEFAWHIFESEEDKFNFEYFDMVISKLKENGIKVILGTPTATPPAWLIKKYPSILSKDINLMPRSFGGRRQCCFNSNVYWDYSKKIVKELVMHYKDEDNIVAWQIDNEVGHEGSDMCYCDNCHKAFQKFLKEKYKNITELNKNWGTVFWSQTYNDFDEIPIPVKTIPYHNPAMQLDYMRFRSKSINDYVNMQIKLIEKYRGERQLITTNIAGGFFDKYFDHNSTVKNLDFVSYDNYPVWGGLKEPIKPYEIAACHDFIRGLKKQNYWIMEELMGAQGHTVIGYLPRPNQAKMWSYQAVAHGCNNLLYFRYRAAVFGTEEFCYGIIDHDNKKGRKFKEVQSFIQDIRSYKDVLNSKIKSDIAILYDYENIWAWTIQPQSSAFNFSKELIRLYEPFYKLNTHIDIISIDKKFENYKVVVVPVMMVMDESLNKRLHEYVENGGTLIFSFRAGIKDKNNNIKFGKTSPCGINDLAGIEINEIESFQEGQSVDIEGKGLYKGSYSKCEVWRDIIECNEAEPLYVYNDKFYKNKACVTLNNYKNGKVYYIGGGVDLKILDNIFKKIIIENKIHYIETPSGIEAYLRYFNNDKYLFIMNHTQEEKVFNNIKFDPYESRIIKL